MTQREKLVELLNKQKGYTLPIWTAPQTIEIMADALLENGVIIPPCKVGDTVYYNCCGSIFKGKCHTITIHENSLQVHLYDFDGDNASYSAKDIFLTKEEAKKATNEIKSGAQISTRKGRKNEKNTDLI